MMYGMSLEQMDHFLRHVKMHAEELRRGEFCKEVESYVSKLRMAQGLALEVSHDMIHVMRLKEFKGYENADFSFDVFLPENWKEHHFREYTYTSFKVGCRLKETLDLGYIPEDCIQLSCEEAQSQLEILGNAIQDVEVMIMMLSTI